MNIELEISALKSQTQGLSVALSAEREKLRTINARIERINAWAEDVTQKLNRLIELQTSLAQNHENRLKALEASVKQCFNQLTEIDLK